jgi:nucleoside-diphosphate-sugar epimerase
MKIAVLGGSGFLGKQIVKLLVSQKNEVACLHRNEHQGCNASPRIDLFKPEALIDFLDSFRPEVLIVTAWITDLNTYKIDPINYRYQRAIEHLAGQLVSRLKFHLVVLGSSAEYGFNGGGCASGVSESNTFNPYSKAKVECYQSLNQIFAHVDSRLTWLRIFQPYGLDQDSMRLIPNAIKHFKEKIPFLLENPHSISDWVTSRDVAHLIGYCIENKTPEIVDIGTGVQTTNKDILNLLRLKMEAPESLLVFPPHSKATSLYLDVENSFLHKAGFVPRDSVSDGLDWILKSCQ